MSDLNSTAALAKTTVVAGSGFVVWGLSLNEYAAMLSIILIVITIAEKLGVLGWIKDKFKKSE